MSDLDSYVAAARRIVDGHTVVVVDGLIEWARLTDPAPAWLCDLGEHDDDGGGLSGGGL